MPHPLRIVILTHGPLWPAEDAFFRRLSRDPELDLVAIVVDEAPWDLQTEGPLVDDVLGDRTGARSVTAALWQRWDHDHPPRLPPPHFDTLSADGIAVHRTSDLDGAECAAFLRSVGADLGVLVSSRLPSAAIAAIPRHGIINLHHHRLPDYPGVGSPVGYWEVVNRDPSIAVTVHQCLDREGAGAVLADETIEIEPFDTLASLRIKARVRGLALLHRTLGTLAAGIWPTTGREPGAGLTHYPPGRLAVELLERRLCERQRVAHGGDGGVADAVHRRPATWLKYLLAYPFLAGKRRRLIATGQAPIVSIFYHRVANDAATQGTLPLEKFVAQIEMIRRRYPIVSLDEAARRLESGHNDELAFVITFDDGYAADFETSIPYLRHFDIPATFFVSIGNVLEQRLFPHDEARGIRSCPPMAIEQLRSLDRPPFRVGAHGLFHEHFGELSSGELEYVMTESRRQLEEVLGRPIPHFAFPRGQKGSDITEVGWRFASEVYDVVASAYSGFNFAKDGKKHLKRVGHPFEPVHLVKLMDGFRGLSDLLRNDLWGYRRSAEPAY